MLDVEILSDLSKLYCTVTAFSSAGVWAKQSRACVLYVCVCPSVCVYPAMQAARNVNFPRHILCVLMHARECGLCSCLPACVNLRTRAFLCAHKRDCACTSVYAMASLLMHMWVYARASVSLSMWGTLCMHEGVFARMRVSLHAHLYMCAYLCI